VESGTYFLSEEISELASHEGQSDFFLVELWILTPNAFSARLQDKAHELRNEISSSRAKRNSPKVDAVRLKSRGKRQRLRAIHTEGRIGQTVPREETTSVTSG